MKTMARILMAMLVIAMMVCVVGCGNNNGVENNDVENTGNENVVDTNPKQEEIIDNYYEPATENLVGVALYPVEDKYNYPYKLEEHVTDMSKWKFIYKIDENTYAYDDNIVDRAEGRGAYISDKGYYWGYVYCENGSYYILATYDYCDCSDGEDYRSCAGPINLTGYVIDTIPDAYAFEYSWFNYITTEMRDYVVYNDSECPAKIILPDKTMYNMLCVKYMFNGQKIDTALPMDSDIMYDNIVSSGGRISWAFDGFKDGESYQYYIDIIHPDFQ